jgi:hypothetical protein
MRPDSVYRAKRSVNLAGKNKGLASASVFANAKRISGEVIPEFEVLDGARGVATLMINPDPFPKRRNATHILGNKSDTRLSGLFPLGSDFPLNWVGGFPKSGPDKDTTALLVTITDDTLTIYVFLNFGHDKTILVSDWIEGNLDGVDLPRSTGQPA